MKRTYKHIVAAVLSLILIASFFVLPAAAMDATGTGFFGNVIDDKCFYERAVKPNVVVTGGVWKDTVGVIQAINENKQSVTINVDLFGRETPVEISFTEIKKM